MSKVRPLIKWTGYDTPSIEQKILDSVVLPGERVISGPIEWAYPAYSLAWPNVQYKMGPQSGRQIIVTERAVYFVIIDSKNNIASQTRVNLDKILSLSVVSTFRKMWSILLKTESVVLLKLTYLDGQSFAYESQYEEASDLAKSLQIAHAQFQGGTSRNALSVAEEIEKLSKLKDMGILSTDDWERAKQLYLGKPPDSREATIKTLGHLHELFKTGALSESEFRMKKWEILSKK